MDYVSDQTVIGGIECDLEIEDGVSHCYLNRGRYSGTLEFLKCFGFLEDEMGNQLPIGRRDQKSIEQWADANGY